MAGGGIPRLLACDTIRLARGFQQRFREKLRPAQFVPRLFREKVRPARGFHRHFREKTRPAGHQTPNLVYFEHAGRTFSRSRPPSDRAGRTFSRAGCCDVATLKPMTPLQPLMQTNVKPPSPLQPKTTPKTPISHPQRRCRFHLRLALHEQRRQGFHRRDFRCPRAMAEPGRAPSKRAEPHISDQAPPVWRAPEGPEGTGGLRDRPLRAAGSRVAISRAAGPDGARNTSGAASNKLNREFRLHRRCEGRKRAWLQRPWATAGPGRASPSDTSATGVEGAGGSAGPGCGGRGRWRGLAGLRDDAPSEARGADGERAGRRPRAHQAARPSGATAPPEIRRSAAHGHPAARPLGSNIHQGR